jgi:general secretion pathway protein C
VNSQEAPRQIPQRWIADAAPIGAAVALAVLTACDFTRIAFGIVGPRHKIEVHGPSHLTTQAIGPGIIVAAHLFGTAPAPVPDAQNAAVTARPLVLTGAMATRDPKVGYAIIGQAGQSTHLYHAGAALEGIANGHLYEVFNDRVVLDLGNRFEILRMPHTKRGAGQLVVVTAPADAEPDGGDVAENPAPLNTPLQLATLTESAFGNLRPVRVNTAGKFAGMRLNPNKSDQKKFGLRTGDVVTAVDGVPIDDPETLTNVLKASDTGSMSLKVLRDGNPVDIQVSADQ